MKGLLARGEKGHGMAMRSKTKAAINHRNIALNFSWAEGFLFATEDPIVMNKTAANIIIG